MIEVAEKILKYSVPILREGGISSDGDCLGSFNAEEYLPFILDDDKVELLIAMDQVMEKMITMSAVDWCGVYMRIPDQDHLELPTESLLKICYRGGSSRALFPLTNDPTQQSNSASVAMSAQANRIDDVKDYVSQGGHYYQCDARVQSEYCHPLVDQQGECIGIVDLESFEKQSFSDENFMSQILEMTERIESLLRAFVAEI